MPSSEEDHFIGFMPVERFYKEFIELDEEIPECPIADFSKILEDDDRHGEGDMCTSFIQAVEEYGLCPGLHLFVTKTKKRWHEETSEQPRSSCTDSSRRIARDPGLCATVAARRKPAPRLKNSGESARKKSSRKTRRRNVAEYYSFGNSLLGIEMHPALDGDPFAEPGDYEPSRASSEAPSSRAEPSSSASRRPSNEPPSPAQGDIERVVAAVSTHTADTASNIPSPVPEHGGPSTLKHSALHPHGHDGQPPASRPLSKTQDHLPILRTAEEYQASCASLIAHAKAQLTRQHRLCFFQVVITANFARFIRWDRSGAVASERFSYIDEPHLLAEFLWAFAHMSDSQYGLDPTVALATREETRLFERAVKGFLDDMDAGTKDGRLVRSLPDAQLTLDPTETYPTWRIRATDDATGKATDLVVRRPFVGHSALFGRATRAYIAYDLSERRLLFLKDTWRISHPTLRPEYTTYQTLSKHGVPHIPEILYGGDVRNDAGGLQSTLSQWFATGGDDWLATSGEFKRYIHHRLVQDLAYPLGSAVNEREYIQAIHDALSAMSHAYEDAGLLHRDLSIDNVMIDAHGQGILNDWDHAGSKKSQECRIGTWQFMSTPLLENPTKIHDITDDLQSIFWILVYGALKRFALPNQTLPLYIFDEQITDQKTGLHKGGKLKRTYVLASLFRRTSFSSETLGQLIHESSRAWHIYDRGPDDFTEFDNQSQAKAEIVQTYHAVSTPSYWLDKFAAVLRDLVVVRSAKSQQASSYNLKRKVRDADLELGDASSLVQPRRSKRSKFRGTHALENAL